MPNEQQLVSSRLGRSTPVTMVSIIDDDECAREAMGDLVQSLGYDVATSNLRSITWIPGASQKPPASLPISICLVSMASSCKAG